MDRKDQNQNRPLRIELTEEQRDKIRQATGKDAEAVELTAEQLEDRVAPYHFGPSAM